MTSGLSRYQNCGDLHFITFNCYQRRPYFRDSPACALFENALEDVRGRYRLAVLGYVIMPEHVLLLVNEPGFRQLDRAIQAIKVSVSRRRSENPFWQPRYYDFNVYTAKKTTEKLRYLHAIRSRADWSRSQRIGHGRASAITQPASRALYRLNRSGGRGDGKEGEWFYVRRNVNGASLPGLQHRETWGTRDGRQGSGATVGRNVKGASIPGLQHRETWGTRFQLTQKTRPPVWAAFELCGGNEVSRQPPGRFLPDGG